MDIENEKLKLDVLGNLEKVENGLKAIHTEIDTKPIEAALRTISEQVNELEKILSSLQRNLCEQNKRNQAKQRLVKIAEALEGKDIEDFDFRVQDNWFRWSQKEKVKPIDSDDLPF